MDLNTSWVPRGPFSLAVEKRLLQATSSEVALPTEVQVMEPKTFYNYISRPGLVVKALGYKPEGRGYDSTCWGGIFNLRNPSGRTRSWGLLNL
jgi:hypothetical protein